MVNSQSKGTKHFALYAACAKLTLLAKSEALFG
jgi:hypothetical protein